MRPLPLATEIAESLCVTSARSRQAELLVLCARIGFNP